MSNKPMNVTTLDPRWKHHRDTASIKSRIENLGDMDERHKMALAAGDRQALVELAGEYMLVGSHGGCPRMAHDILMEAENL